MRTPLTKPSSQPRVRAPWHRRRLFPLMMLGFGLAVTGAVYLLLTTLAYRAMKAEFTAAARDHVEAIRREVEGSLQALHSVGALFDASETVTRAEFDAFVRSTLTDLGQIDAVAWVPRVSADQRDAFETRARHEGITRFRIVEHHHTDQGPPAPAPRDRSVFYPVSYIAPATRNEPILGLDLAAHATCRAALQRACRSGKVDGTGPIRLARKHADAITELFLLPLWPQEGLHPPPCPDVRGFIVAFLTPDRLAERALASLGSRRMNVRLYDIRADGTTDLLHASVRPGSTAAGGHPSAADPALSHAGIVNVAGRAWQVRCDAPKAYLGAYAPRYPLIILIIGSLLSVVAAAYLRSTLTRTHTVRRMVAERTEELTASEERFRRAITHAPFPVMIHADDGEVLLISHGWKSITGYAIDDIPTVAQWRSRAYGESAELTQAQIDVLYKCDHCIQQGEATVRTRSGEERIWDFSSVPLGALPDGRRMVMQMAADVTAHKQIETELKQAKEDADAASRAKSEFLASMSHELRTPLNGVIGMMELLLQTSLDDRQRRFAWLAKSSGDMLLTLINDVLDFSKIEAGKLELENIDFDLHYTVENVAVSFASAASQKGLELVCAVHPSVPRRVRGDPGRVQQVLVNLVNNAIKFTERGEIVIRAARESQDDAGRPVVRFTVSDTGVGVPPERRNRLFKTFSQVDTSTTRKFGGTGLGLAICRRLVEAMHGTIGVESEEGRGSTFWFTLPLQERATPDDPAAPALDDIRRVRVLAVDDNATNREILTELLQHWELDHTVVSDGEQALAALAGAHHEGRAYAIALIDMQMPGMDGRELAHRIKSDVDVENTVLISLTSQADPEPHPLLAAGFAGWLHKPVRQSELLDVLAEAVTCARIGRTRLRRHAARAIRGTGAPVDAGHSGRILLAEDNEISEEVARTILTNAGYECEVARDGRQACEAAAAGTFDLILMDCQMPEMDGYEATRKIRADERQHGDCHVPIVALTANATTGDRDRCLEAGMDDYISKPLDPARLLAIVKSYLAKTRSGEDERAAESPPVDVTTDVPPIGEHASGDGREANRLFDRETLLKRWGNDYQLAERLIASFTRRLPGDIERIEAALHAADADQVAHLAHTLKGAAAHVAAGGIRRCAGELERLARRGDFDGAMRCVTELKSALAVNAPV